MQAIEMFHIVENHPYLSDVLGRVMISLGYQVKVFTSSQDYLQYTQSDEFVMPIGVITEIDMPVLNGYEMMQAAHQMHPSLKFVAATSDPFIDHAYKSKACLYIWKPIDPDILACMAKRLSECRTHGPSADIGCVNCDDRDAFCLVNWLCPHP